MLEPRKKHCLRLLNKARFWLNKAGNLDGADLSFGRTRDFCVRQAQSKIADYRLVYSSAPASTRRRWKCGQ